MSVSPETEALRAAAGGDHLAWQALVDRHAQAVWTTAVEGGLTGPEAADVCQVTWLRLAQQLHDFVAGAPLRPWLLAVAQCEARRVSRLRSFAQRMGDRSGTVNLAGAGLATAGASRVASA